MADSARFRIAVLPGDGIGPEIMAPTLALIERAAALTGGFALEFETCPAGAGQFQDHGEGLPAATLETARRADAILLGAMGLPGVRYADGTEVSPQIDLRFALDLYAGVRPVRAIPGVPLPLADARAREIDLVILRESTEGLFASHGKGEVSPERASETLVMTRGTTERLHDFGLRLAAERGAESGTGHATCVDKANVLRAFAWFREIFDARTRAFPQVIADHLYIDACALALVQRPSELDVLITENMFGDILSDLGAGLIGGMGYAPSADIGDGHALFQPCHGSAPGIAETGRANPTAIVLSAAMMLDWLGRRSGVAEARRAGAMLRRAVDAAFAPGRLTTCELGGTAGTAKVAAAIQAALEGPPDKPVSGP